MKTPIPPARLRMRTVVLGLIALAVSVSLLVGALTSFSIPAGTLFLAVLIVSGLLLLGSGIASAIREQRAQYDDTSTQDEMDNRS
jgi:uncharacterized membrane protein